MANENDKALAVKVAGEAVRSGDSESIGDARIGLVAHGLEDHVVFQQLSTAARLLDPSRALRDAPGEAAFIELLVQLWNRKAFRAVSFGLGLLGVQASEAQLGELEAAIAAVNGKRRTELLFATDVFSVVLELRHGVAASRRPVDDRGWRRKTTTRSMCALERQPDGKLRLEVGTELSSSYALSQRATTVLSLTFEPAPVPTIPLAAPGEVSIATPDTLAHELRVRLTALLSGEPGEQRFNQLLDALGELGDSPQADAAVALAARSLSRWPDRHRRARWNRPLTPRLMSLVRTICGDLGGLTRAAAGGPWSAVREVRLTGYELGDQLERPGVLEAFPSLHTLSLGSLVPSARLKLPSSLERLALRHDLERHSPWSEDGLRALIPRLSAECPSVTHLEVGHGLLAPLAELPQKIALSVFGLHRAGDAIRLGQSLRGRPLETLSISTWPGAADELLAAKLPAQVARLHVEATPGELALLLQAPWPRLKELRVTLPAEHARMHRKKPPDYSFTRDDLEALAASRFLSQLEGLELCGVIGEELAELLVAALAREKPRLTRLTLNAGEIGNDALATLAEAGLLTSVRHLELFRCRLKASGLTALLGAHGPSELSTLVLAKNAANQQAIEALSAWSGLTSVTRLDLREVTLSPAQRASLEASPYLQPDALDASDASFW